MQGSCNSYSINFSNSAIPATGKWLENWRKLVQDWQTWPCPGSWGLQAWGIQKGLFIPGSGPWWCEAALRDLLCWYSYCCIQVFLSSRKWCSTGLMCSSLELSINLVGFLCTSRNQYFHIDIVVGFFRISTFKLQSESGPIIISCNIQDILKSGYENWFCLLFPVAFTVWNRIFYILHMTCQRPQPLPSMWP